MSNVMTDSTTYFLCTGRLGFRRWKEDDIDFALGLWADIEVTNLIDARGKLTKQQVQDLLSKEIMTDKSYGIQYWPIFLRSNEEHIGCCGLRPYDVSGKIFEIGFHIRSKHWGCGFASEAARAVIEYAFTTLDASALFAGHNPKNEASRHLLDKLGFRYTHDEYYNPTGLNHPSYLLTVQEYNDFNRGS